MKAELTIKNKGSSLVEILIALAIFALGISAATLLSFANQSLKLDSESEVQALIKAQKLIENARAESRGNFPGVVTTTFSAEDIYSRSQTVSDLTPCLKEISALINWSTQTNRPQQIDLKSKFSDIAGAFALGGDCDVAPPSSNWDNPQRFASDTFNPGKPTAIDVLNKIVYLGADVDPYLRIADTHGATLGQSGGLLLPEPYSNGFSAGAEINSLDSIRWLDTITGNYKFFVFAAMDTASNQLKVFDVTDMAAPVTVATIPLSACVTGANPEGWRLKYYGDKLYLITRFTAGPEFHIFNASNPAAPSEYALGSVGCKGFNLGDTVEDIEIRDQNIGGVIRRFAYFATDEIDKELRVFDVTDPLNIIEITAANKDLPGPQDGQSVYIVGNKLYLGRQSAPGGPDLYIYDITNPTLGLTQLGSTEINTGVLGIRVSGPIGFFVTPKSNEEIQVWNISDPQNVIPIVKFNFTNIAEEGIDFEGDFLYATGNSTPNFQILYDAP